jgi:hypothetical protein
MMRNTHSTRLKICPLPCVQGRAGLGLTLAASFNPLLTSPCKLGEESYW